MTSNRVPLLPCQKSGANADAAQKRARDEHEPIDFAVSISDMQRPSPRFRPSKVPKYHEMSPGQEISMVFAAMASHDDPVIELEEIGDGFNVDSTGPHAERPIFDAASVGFRRSHGVLRSILRRGERLTESLFDQVEELGSTTSSPLIAIGASGRIWKVRLKDNPAVLCVLKSFSLVLKVDELENFEEHVRSAYGHQHPNIVPLYDVCCKRVTLDRDGNGYGSMWQLSIFLHWADLGSLASAPLPRPFSAQLTMGVAHQLLEALRFLHQDAHVCHRDLKPSNVLLRSDGRVLVQDFGNSRQLSHTFHSMRTYIGSQVYMSPERINGMQYNCKSDIWATGLILMELLLGRYPYSMTEKGDDAVFDLLTDIVEKPIPMSLLSQLDVPAMVQHFLARLLVKDEKLRPTADMLIASSEDAEVAAEENAPSMHELHKGFGIAGFLDLDLEDSGEQNPTAADDCDELPEALPCRTVLYSLPGASQHAVANALHLLRVTHLTTNNK